MKRSASFMLRTGLVFAAFFALSAATYAQTLIKAADFKEVTDSLATLIRKRTTVEGELKLKEVERRGNDLDFYFDISLSDYPWREDDVEWFRKTLKELLPKDVEDLDIGNIYSRNTPLEKLPTPKLGKNGRPSKYEYTYTDRYLRRPFVEREGAERYPRGMSGRNIALWQSHGRYFDTATGEWQWQRPSIHRTVEDIYTQSYVIPFLIPMLENAGAYVLTPRERDIQKYEIIIDNDPSFKGERPLPLRQRGSYSEKGPWENAGTGFADTKAIYMLDDTPFTYGTARSVGCSLQPTATAKWTFAVPERGTYAVYVSYVSHPGSSTCAHYTVEHMGGKSGVIVDQSKGGGTWVYIGSFEFREMGAVTLDNGTPPARDFVKGRSVSADAVKIGGGMGKIARGTADQDSTEFETSGLPAFLEGALYSMQWAGIDSTVTGAWSGEYTRDYASRGAWASHMSGGSVSNPKQQGRRIPIDMSLAFHSDAGITPNDSTVGTLTIYTLLFEKKDELPDGRNRAIGRHYADLVQSQIVNDVRATFDTSWRRRWVWDRSYSEARTTSVPGILLEVLSHQNFSDMRYGLDPSFRFTVSRAVYKGMLKFLSDIYEKRYVVQPLPVNSLAVSFDSTGTKAIIAWNPTPDPLEPTAKATKYLLQTRLDDGTFDDGTVITEPEESGGFLRTRVGINPGHIYSFRVSAVNEGGKSFPSETLCIGKPSSESKGTVLIINNFDRISGPTWFDTPSYAGFEGSLDSGVPWMYDISLSGEDYQHRRDAEFESNASPGFGASRLDRIGEIIAGNTFDYPSIHGRAILASGYSFISSSRDAWTANPGLSKGCSTVDIICGKQVSVRQGCGSYPDRFEVFPAPLQESIRSFTSGGGNVIISGADIATDVWDRVFPVSKTEEKRSADQEFVETVLGYSYAGGYGSYNAQIAPVKNKHIDLRKTIGIMSYRNDYNPYIYRVENPDALKAVDKQGAVILCYEDTGLGAAVSFRGEGYRVISFGFPIETLKDPEQIRILLASSLDSFLAPAKP